MSSPNFTPYTGTPCPRRCNLCCEHQPPYVQEHHWMLDYGDEDDAGEPQFPEGRLACRHCDATRDLPIEDHDFLEAFNL